MRCCDCEFRNKCNDTEQVLTSFCNCAIRERILAESRKPKKPKFNADDAEDYFSMMYQYNRKEKERIFKQDNEGRDSCNPVYSAEFQKWLGMEIALKNVLEYFAKFEL